MKKTSKESAQKFWQMFLSDIEKPKPSQAPLLRPLEPGLVSSPSSSSTGPYQPPVPRRNWKPKKDNWKRRHRGKRDLKRATEHLKGLQHESFWKMDEEPAPDAPRVPWYPSECFLWESESHLLARYANFLLQSLMNLMRVFEIPSKLKDTFGEGLLTVPRYALFFCRTDLLTNPAARSILSPERHLYARMRDESKGGDGPEHLDDVMRAEWKKHRAQAVKKDRIATWIEEHLLRGIAEGRYPKTNLEHNFERQWDNHWEDFHACLCWHLFT